MDLTSAHTQDAARLAAIHAAAIGGRPWKEEEFSVLLAQQACFALMAGDVGFILCRVAGGEAELLTFAVMPDAQGHGLGKALLASALKKALARGVQAMFLEVAEDNAPARAVYEAAGFLEAGRRAEYYENAGESRKDALVMRRELS